MVNGSLLWCSGEFLCSERLTGWDTHCRLTAQTVSCTVLGRSFEAAKSSVIFTAPPWPSCIHPTLLGAQSSIHWPHAPKYSTSTSGMEGSGHSHAEVSPSLRQADTSGLSEMYGLSSHSTADAVNQNNLALQWQILLHLNWRRRHYVSWPADRISKKFKK